MAAKVETMRRFFLAAGSARRRIIWFAIIGTVLVVAGGGLYLANREELYDRGFDARVSEPAYRGERPRVLFDQAHRNHHTADGRYTPFARLMANDGYDLRPNRDRLSVERLGGAVILVIVCAKGSNDAEDASAFTEAETVAVDQWVHSGGSLLLVTDHFPCAVAAAALGRQFGVELGNGMVEDPNHHEPGRGESHLIFSRENGLLGDHAITRGRNAAERIERVLTFTGHSLR